MFSPSHEFRHSPNLQFLPLAGRKSYIYMGKFGVVPGWVEEDFSPSTMTTIYT